MYYPQKAIKFTQNQDSYLYNQAHLKKNIKSITKEKKVWEKSLEAEEETLNYHTTNNLKENKYIDFKEELISWFFAFDLNERIKLVSIKNKWLTSMIYQMYLKYQSDNKIKFKIKYEEYFEPEDETYYNTFLNYGIVPPNYSVNGNGLSPSENLEYFFKFDKSSSNNITFFYYNRNK